MLTAYPVAGKQRARDICNAFIRGAPPDAVGGVFFGVNDSNVFQWCREKGKGTAIYIDNAWFDVTRGKRYRVARNAPQIDGLGQSDGKRFRALGLEIKPWRKDGEHIVVCPQSDGFLRVMGGIEDWTTHAIGTLSAVSRRELRIREWTHDKAALAATLTADLAGAWALATHSSAAAVQALLEGIPVVSQAGATLLMGRDLEHVESPIMPADRERFFGVLADNEFTLDEMKSGYAWARLNEGVHA